MEKENIEIWKPITKLYNAPDYQVSNLGRVMGPKKEIVPSLNNNAFVFTLYETPGVDKDGKRQNRDQFKKKVSLKRVVASEFLGILDKEVYCVNKNPKDCRAQNLRAGRPSKKLYKERTGPSEKQPFEVIQYEKRTIRPIQVYESLDEASRMTGIWKNHIKACCDGQRNFAGNYMWKYRRDVWRYSNPDGSLTYTKELNKEDDIRQVFSIDLTGEEWKQSTIVPGYEVSNKGRIRGPYMDPNSGYIHPSGYMCIGIDRKLYRMHRLVGQEWCENDDIKNKTVIDHKNGVKCVNSVDNLHWVTYSENTQLAFENGQMSNASQCKKTVQYDMATRQPIRTFKDTGEAAQSCGVNRGNIISCCNQKRSSAGGFLWAYEGDQLPEIKVQKEPSSLGRGVIQFDRNTGDALEYFESAREAAREMGCSSTTIINACNRIYKYGLDFIWRYSDDCNDIQEFIENQRRFMAEKDSLPANEYAKTVVEFDPLNLTEIIGEYVSTRKAAENTELQQKSIQKICREQRGTLKGRVFRYKDDPGPLTPPTNNKKEVIQFNLSTGEEVNRFRSVREAALNMGCTDTCISRCCLRVRRTHKGFLWRYSTDCDDVSSFIQTGKKQNSNGCSKVVYEINIKNPDEILAQYQSTVEAAKATGISAGGIQAVCRGDRNSVHGRKFRYEK